MFRSISSLLLCAALMSAMLHQPVLADNGKTGFYGLGHEVSALEIAGWDIDVRPDGAGLPKGEGTVDEGDELFQEKCAQCHGVFGEGAGRWPVLAGGEDTLSDQRPEKTIGSYWPYATTLWDYIHRAMPFFNPQSLNNNEVYALTAYLLNLNDIVDDDFIASRDTLAEVEMPNRNGFFRDPRPDVPREICMENCKNPDAIQITWDASDLGVTPLAHLQAGEATGGQKQIAAAAAEPAGAAAGKSVYQRACAVCHDAGVAGAPKTGDKNAWLNRIGQGMDTLLGHALHGFRGKAGYMPAKGGQAQLQDDEVADAVQFMVEQSQVKDEQL
jgi:cytochrome c